MKYEEHKIKNLSLRKQEGTMFLKNKNDEAHMIECPKNYTLYGWKRSYFTRKLEAALIFYGASYELQRITKRNEKEIRYRAATHQIPVLHTPENWMIADTTPIVMMLDSRFLERYMFPSGEAGVLVSMLEEYFDEWVSRTSVHWRWNYEENHELLSMDATDGDINAAKELVSWGKRVCRATGVTSETQKIEAEKEYLRILAAAEKQLTQTAYLLGDRPTAVDCIFLGGLRAHFNYDPAPKKVINQSYPHTIEWCEKLANQWNGSGELADFPETTYFGRFILEEMVNTYKPFVLGNKDAIANKDKAFIATIYGEQVSYLARPYIEQSRKMIVNRINTTLTKDKKRIVKSWLSEIGLAEVF